MPQFRFLLLIVALTLTACTGKAVDRPSTFPTHAGPTEGVLQPCPEEASNGNQHAIAAVFVSGKALYGLDDRLETARELVHYNHPVDFATVSAQFTGDGQDLLIHRDWEGRDSWWASRSDGSDIHRLTLPVGYQMESTVRSCQDAFVGALKDGRLVRFDLHGSETYWTPEINDRRMPDTPVVGSPGTNLLAYVSRDGVVILAAKGKGLVVQNRTQGRQIYGWRGDNVLITGDASAFYVFDVQTGERRKAEFNALFTGGPWMVSVSAHAKSPFIYVVGSSPPPNASREVVAVDFNTLRRQPSLPNKLPESVMGAPLFSPQGRFEVWPVEPPLDRIYANSVVLVHSETRTVVHRTNMDMASVPLTFHPRDEGFVFTDLSKQDTRLVFQDPNGQHRELMRMRAGIPFTAFDWNPVLGRH